jgi:hypothetical protein
VERAVSDVRNHPLGYALVIIRELSLGDSIVGKEDLIGMGNGDLVPVDYRHRWGSFKR